MFEQNIGGTSAKIKKGEIYTVEQLLFGLMLPSGNDASLALAVWGGKQLIKHDSNENENRLGSSAHQSRPSPHSILKRDAYCRFIC